MQIRCGYMLCEAIVQSNDIANACITHWYLALQQFKRVDFLSFWKVGVIELAAGWMAPQPELDGVVMWQQGCS